MTEAWSRPLDPQERARISATYGVLVKPDVEIQKVPSGHGTLWQPLTHREQTNSAFRQLERARRLARAKPFEGSGGP